MRVLSMIVLLALLGGSAVLHGQTRDDNWNRCKGSDPDLSIAGCTAIIQSGQENNVNLANAFYNRGITYGHKGEYDLAIQDFDQALRLNPSFAQALNNRGNAYDDKGAYDRAIQDYDQALRLNPSFAQALKNRGSAYDDKGEYDRAIQDYDQALRLDPSFADAFVNRGVAYQKKGAYDRAIQDYDQALRLDPSNVIAFYNRGIAYGHKGEYDLAILDYRQTLRLNPNYPGAQAALDKALKAKGNAAVSPQVGAITYDLAAAEDANSGGVNPRGPWGFLSGSTVLSFHTIPQPSGSCFSSYAGLTTDWSVGNAPGNCIPAFAVASGTGPGLPADFLAGDVLVHSQDNGSGSANGQASVTWTAPASGTITVAGTIWYAQSAQGRSNDFTLTLGGRTLATGTVAYNSPAGSSRANPLLFSGGGTLSVTAGEVLALEIQRSAGETYGSIDGINLTVTETTATQ